MSPAQSKLRPIRRESVPSLPPDAGGRALPDAWGYASPREVLAAAGIMPRRTRSFEIATGEIVEREVGYAILVVDRYETTDEVVFAEPGDATLFGVRTIEGFGVTVDNVAHRFIARNSIVAEGSRY